MPLKNKPVSAAIQQQSAASDNKHGGSSTFSPLTNIRVMLTPPMKSRIARRFYELQHGIRRIARGERLPEVVVEEITRERYWDNRRDDDTGPFPGGAVSHRRFGGGLLGAAGRKAA